MSAGIKSIVAASLAGALFLAASCEINSESGDSDGLAVSPPAAYLAAGSVSVVKFTVTGGDSNYTWAASSSTLGTLYAAGGTALYQSTEEPGTNTITVADGSGCNGTAVVVQQ